VAQNWAVRKEALDKKETQEEKLARARDLLNQEKIVREAINTDKTLLGKAAHVAGTASAFLQLVNTPFVNIAAVASGASSFTSFVNERQVNKPVKKAKKGEKKATEEATEAEESFHHAQESVIALHNKAQSQEHQSALEEYKIILEKAQALQLPKSDSQEAWTQWTSQILPENRNRPQVITMATYGSNNRSRVKQQVAQTWSKQVEAL
jgi:hypothetical protein